MQRANNSATASIVGFLPPDVFFSKRFFNLPEEVLSCGSGQFQFQHRLGLRGTLLESFE
jgi:hypothetical protein